MSGKEANIAGSDPPILGRPLSGKLVASLLFLLVAVAILVRCWNADFGIQGRRLHPDEEIKTQVVRALYKGERTGYFRHPGMMLNLATIACWMRQPPEKPLLARHVLKYGRWVSILLGALSVLPLYGMARLAVGDRAALWAAGFLAFAPGHIVHSRYLKEDVTLTFFLLVTCWLLVEALSRIEQRRAMPWVVATAVGVGTCVASKFVGAAMLPWLYWLVWRMKLPKGRALGLAAALTGVVVITFIACSPQVVREFAVAQKDFILEVKLGAANPGKERLFFWEIPDLGTYFFFNGIGVMTCWPVAIAGVAGVVLAVHSRQKIPLLATVAMLLLTWYVIAESTPSKRRADAERYALPCVPFLIVFAAHACERMSRQHHLAGQGLATLLLIGAATQSVAQTVAIYPDTRTMATEWLKANGPKGTFTVGSVEPTYRGADIDQKQRVDLNLFQTTEELRQLLPTAQLLSTESTYTDRFDAFMGHDPLMDEKLALVRSSFPYVKRFEKPWWARAGFHNPTIEVRFRDAVPGLDLVKEKAP